MKISQIIAHLQQLETVAFQLPNGQMVPPHFHITEVGTTTKHFIDCGGDIHEEKRANLQIWVADDYDHRLLPATFLKVIQLSEKVLQGQDLDIEVECQTTDTIGKFGLEFANGSFQLMALHTDCLAKVQCNIPVATKPSFMLVDIGNDAAAVCVPGGGCC